MTPLVKWSKEQNNYVWYPLPQGRKVEKMSHKTPNSTIKTSENLKITPQIKRSKVWKINIATPHTRWRGWKVEKMSLELMTPLPWKLLLCAMGWRFS